MSVTIPVLSIKDNNTWQQIPALQGQKGADGDDYILTQSDKNEIAEIVYNMLTPAESVEV